MQNHFEENEKQNNSPEEQSYVYEKVMTNKKIRRTWSVVSLVFSILSLGFFWLPWLGLVFGALTLIFGLLSRKELSYFDSISLTALIIGVFGIVFAIVCWIFGGMLSGLGLPF